METQADALVCALDAQDIRALRSADSISFRLHNGQATVEANKDGRNTHDGFDAKHSIYCAGSVVDYSRDTHYVGPDEIGRYSGFEMRHSPGFDRTSTTLIGRLRAGDTIKLVWTRSNDNENTRGIGWHRDELHMEITSAKGKRETYLVDVSVGPDNSARMIRIVR